MPMPVIRYALRNRRTGQYAEGVTYDCGKPDRILWNKDLIRFYTHDEAEELRDELIYGIAKDLEIVPFEIKEYEIATSG